MNKDLVKIAVVGTRGFPHVQGGVEAHCEKLYPNLADMGCDITVFARKPYVRQDTYTFESVKLVALDCPKSRTFEAIIHTFKGIFAAKKIKPDILHIHAIGPALLTPFARIMGMKVVVTHHGPDYERKKWGLFAKCALRLGECLGSVFSNARICISKNIGDSIKAKYKKDAYIIPNGVDVQGEASSNEMLEKYSLRENKYIFALGRFVPEKGFIDLINAYNRANPDGCTLVIAGAADHESDYSRKVHEKAKENKNIILTGFLSRKEVNELYRNAGFFVLPSYYEGLPIVLLEALSHGLLCLVSDIPANRNVTLPEENFFEAGDVEELSEKIILFAKKSMSSAEKSEQIEYIRRDFGWENIARDTLNVYKNVVEEEK